jgi:hypothetical protein
MVPWIERPTLSLDLSGPVETRYATVPRDIFACCRQLLDATLTLVPPAARALLGRVRPRWEQRFRPEAAAVAPLLGASWQDLLLANLCYDLSPNRVGCSTIALPTPHGPVLARNLDWWPEDLLAQAGYLMRFTRDGAPAYACASWPGTIGTVTALSARGFALVLNAVSSTEGREAGYPVLLHLRRVIEDAADFDDALRMLSEEVLLAPALITLVGRENGQRVVVERTPTRHAHRWPEGDEPLVTTNHYRLMSLRRPFGGDEVSRAGCGRYAGLWRFFADHRPGREVTDAALLYALTDPSVIQSCTAQHVIMRPRTGETRLFVPRRLLPRP